MDTTPYCRNISHLGVVSLNGEIHKRHCITEQLYTLSCGLSMIKRRGVKG